LDVTHYLLWVFTRVREDMNLDGVTERVSDDATSDDLRQTGDLVLDRLDIKSDDPLLGH